MAAASLWRFDSLIARTQTVRHWSQYTHDQSKSLPGMVQTQF